MKITRYWFVIAVALVSSVAYAAEEAKKDEAKTEEAKIVEGHSLHGEAFDQGPRQAAYLMQGTGNVSFPVTTRDQQVQKFFNQGVGQLHGFWYFEAERSFRQAAALDPDCAMTYWGMAMANVNNSKRAEKFIAEAVTRREKASKREQMWIDAYSAFYKADAKKDKERREALVNALEDIVNAHPDDVEAKAYLVLQIWLNKGTIPIGSKQAVDALIEQVLAANPMHPIHHYRIHLWDEPGKANRALKSASLGGQAAPGVAHQWHMPGHTFSKLERYADAAWQQEAASRTDHAYMIRDFVMPDQIHNYAHNHEWLIRDLSHIGRVHYGVELAKNLVEMPRHPKFNVSTKSGSAQYGRSRLIELLQRFELWEDVVALADTSYLEATDTPREQVRRLRLLAAAHDELGNEKQFAEMSKQLDALLAKEKENQKAAGDKAAAEAAKKPQPKPATPAASAAPTKPATVNKPATRPAGPAVAVKATPSTPSSSNAVAKAPEKPVDPIAKARQDAENPFRAQIAVLDAAVAEMKGRKALHDEDYDVAVTELKKAGITSGEYLSRVQLAAGKKDEAERLARNGASQNKKQVVPAANLVYVLWNLDKQGEAKKLFTELRTLAAVADLDTPVFSRLRPIAEELGWPEDWRTPAATPSDVGVRPPLDSLGPIRWTPPVAPTFELTTLEGKKLSSALSDGKNMSRGKNVLFIFYLGFGCLHCTEQLKAFKPLTEDYRKAGIEIVAVATDSPQALRDAQAALTKDEKYPFTIVSNEDLSVFKKYRAYDDFEKQALHATVLVDGYGRLRWIDVGPDPFSDAKFLLGESKRLLSFTPPAAEATAQRNSEE